MTDDDAFELSRRKALAGIGTIGVASAGAGLGTSAFFSDEENFEGNRLTAGSLDLKLDWEEHYSDWSEDEEDAVSDIIMAEPGTTLTDIPEDYTGLPTPENALIAIPTDEVGDFMDATALEAYPDTDDNGIQDFPDGWEDPDSPNYICERGADTPEDLDPNGGETLRSDNDDTIDPESGEVNPLINLDDVKPGDFGELTLSTHLCDNDGYLWLTGELTEDAENSLTEPEAKDPDEDNEIGDTFEPGDGELADTIRVAAWYDDGDNVKEDGENYITQEATLSGFLAAANVGNGIALGPQTAGSTTLTCAPDVASITDDDDDGLDVGDSVDITQPGSGDTLTIEIDDEVEDPNKVAFTGNFPSGSEAEVEDYLGVCQVTIVGTDGEVTRDYGDGGCVRSSQLLPVETDVGTVTSLEFDLCQVQEEPGTRECFTASETDYIGFAWWLPVDHANEIQTDSVAFDLGFYTEQCRHNDGSGMPPEGS
jgi:predicted ribosomally synthesized peptide with SipW-like signal peptide